MDGLGGVYQYPSQQTLPAIEDTVGAVAELLEQGKVRHIGRSGAHVQCTPSPPFSRSTRCGRDLEPEVIPTLRELGIGLVPFPPLGHGFLTGTIRSPEQFDDDADFSNNNPRFTGENVQRNLRVADEVAAVADEIGAMPAQVALV